MHFKQTGSHHLHKLGQHQKIYPNPLLEHYNKSCQQDHLKLYFPKILQMLFLFNFFVVVNFNFFYFFGDNESGILNVIATNNHLNIIQNPLVVQIRLHILAICLLSTTLYIQLESSPIGLQNKTCGAIGSPAKVS